MGWKETTVEQRRRTLPTDLRATGAASFLTRLMEEKLGQEETILASLCLRVEPPEQLWNA
jgi:hypothetical protein